MFPSRPREVDIGPAGSVTYFQRYYGTMATYHDLADFPFDEQVFRVSLMPVQWTDGDIRLVVHERATGRRELLNISDWTIERVEGVIASQPAVVPKTASKPRYDYLITAQRITGFYLWKAILPLCLIVATWG